MTFIEFTRKDQGLTIKAAEMIASYAKDYNSNIDLLKEHAEKYSCSENIADVAYNRYMRGE